MTTGIVCSTDLYHKKASVIVNPDTDQELIQIISGIYALGDEVVLKNDPVATIQTADIKDYFDDLAWKY